MKNYDKLKQIIQKANSSILELEFGCEILDNIYIPGKRYTILYQISGQPNYYCCDPNDCGNEKTNFTINDKGGYKLDDGTMRFTILGRPICLADVLLALGDKYGIDGTGMFLERQFGTSAYDCAGVPGCWDLSDDNLDNQSDETKEFLIDLIK